MIRRRILALPLLVSLVIVLMLTPLVSATTVDGLISHWSFDEGTGATAFDSVGSNHGTLTGATWDSYNFAPIPGNASSLRFVGTSHVSVEHAENLNVDHITLSAWVYADASTTEQMNIIRKGPTGSGTARVYGLTVRGGAEPKLRGWVVLEGGALVDADGGSISLQFGTWYHVALTYDGVMASVYVDGELYKQSTPRPGDIGDNSSGVGIGGYPGLSGWGFKGNIDDVRIYDIALTQAAIKTLYDSTAPSITELVVAPNPVAVGNSVTVSASVTDNLSGVHSVQYSTDSGVTWNGMDHAGSSSYVGVMASLPVGVYEVMVRATDKVGNISSVASDFLAVYDPSVGFVTGGGWIDSPIGASVLYPEAVGKASFGFVSRYQRGASIPTGNTQFQFKAGNLSFHSAEYQWLVVTGSNVAQFRGSGTINGEGNYEFMIWAADGGVKGLDSFRIKIWTYLDGTETVVYDNKGYTPLGGGSIVVHSK